MDPDFQNNQPSQPQQPIYQPANPQPPVSQPQTPSAPSETYGGDYSPGSDNKTKKLLIVIAALVGLFIIIAIIALALRGGGETPSDIPQEGVSGEFYVKEPTAVDVESVNNSISDNISGLSTDADFPEDSLSDQNLGL